MDHFERIRGTNLAWFGVDELTYCKEEAWLRLVGRLRDPAAKMRIGFACWTPKGFDWVYERFITTVDADGFLVEDVLDLYHGRGAFEVILADEDVEEDPDRWCSYTECGQERNSGKLPVNGYGTCDSHWER